MARAPDMGETIKQTPKLKLISRSGNTARAAELKNLLDRFRTLCEESGEGFADALARIAELQERLSAERFHLAVLGQFKRGKSTLLNALLGEALLPTGVVPLTSIPTFLRAGQTRAVRVFFYDGRQAVLSDLTREQAYDVLARHVTEEKNPRNRLEVERVEVEHPSSLLSAGVVLIDTPGIGSTLRHNTEATLNFLPQCDAALFVISADPPITEVEKDFLKAVRSKVAKLCFVMNKIDYLAETEVEEAVEFFFDALKEAGFRDNTAMFRVSAKRGIDARIKEDALLWSASGVEELQSYLLDFFSREKSRTLQIALAGKAASVVADASMNVKLQQRSLELSQEELEKRLKVFEGKVTEIVQEKIKMGDLLAGDRKRTVEFLEQLAETLRREGRDNLRRMAKDAFEDKRDPVVVERQVRTEIATEIPAFFQAKLASFSSAVERALQESLRPYQEGLDALIGTIRSTAAELFDIPYRAPAGDGRLEKLHKPYWVTQKWSTLISPMPEAFLDRFLPPELRKHRVQKRLNEDIDSLVTHNVENIRWATLRNLDDTFRSFSSTLDERLKETAEATREAMRAAHRQRERNEDAVQSELMRLQQKAAELASLEQTLAQFAAAL